MSADDLPACSSVTIVGGGYSAATAAVQLVRASEQPVAITIVEPGEEVGRGLAYSTTDADHRLNGTLENHLLDPADPGHFARWCADQQIAVRDPDAIGPHGTLFVRRHDFGAFVAETVRRVTPRAALLSALAGIAITFIAMDFTFKIFARPLVALLPMAIIFVAYFSRQRLPLGLPGGMLAIAIGTGHGWALGTMNGNAIAGSYAFALPKYSGDSLWQAITDPAFLSYFSVILPMGIFNVIGSLQNIESA